MAQRDLFVTPPNDLKWDDVQAFLDQGLPEGERIDYKRELNDRVPQSIAAMANTTGGVILVGVDEDPNTKKPKLPPIGVSDRHIGGGTLANLCYGQIQPSHLPLSRFVAFPSDPQRGVLVIQVRPELARIPLWERTLGVVIRIGDQNRPPDLQRLRALITAGDRRMNPIRRLVDEDVGHALSANAEDRTYVVVGAMIQRSQAQDQWTDAERRELGSAVSISLQEGSDSHDANLMLVQHDDNPFTYIALKSEGVATITLGWKRDPFPIPWAIAGLIVSIRILLSDPFKRAYQPIAPMEVTLGLVNWPEHGLDIDGLYPLGGPRPVGYLRSRRISRKYSLASDSQPWTVVGPFTSYMLGAAGYIDYERFLDEPPATHLIHMVMNDIGLSLG